MGNIMSGQELIRRQENVQVYGNPVVMLAINCKTSLL